MHVYVDGVEIDKNPELAKVCAAADWFGAFLEWVGANRPGGIMDVIVQAETLSVRDATILEIWVDGAPPMRAMEIGGVVTNVVLPPQDMKDERLSRHGI